MVAALRRPNTTVKLSSSSSSLVAVLVVVVSMIWWNTDVQKGGLFLFVEGSSITTGRSNGIWSNVAPSNVGIAVAVTAMAGIAVAATFVYTRRGSLKSPWSLRKRKSALTAHHWKNLFTPDGRFYDGGVKFLKKVRSGVSPSVSTSFVDFINKICNGTSTQLSKTKCVSNNFEGYKLYLIFSLADQTGAVPP